ncbi:helix-turn-helix domain-containing protein [Pyxidicoccus xibeiensis]|uniref:helix-turn-helix domain-containing protein n=1 Tax=Pyxidicoccus xibeiensis TaxID=2906759 RepID=UPI0020A7A982|nr:AraC family transcriptional regulator [Pyxidicoccus xibeiensis]MCP3141374.1 AraC family transcriptional regulator [Pyxidicoccus xibeiensis]
MPPSPELPPEAYNLPQGFYLVRRVGRSSHVARGPTHRNPGYELSWVVSGRIEFELPRDRLSGAAGSCLLLPPGLLNTPAARNMDVLQLMLAPSLVEEALKALGRRVRLPLAARALAPGSRLGALCHALALESTHVAEDDPALGALVYAVTLGLVREDGPRASRGMTPGIRRALDLIEAQLDQPLRVEDMAQVAGMARFDFMRAFRDQVGQSPYRHLTRRRLERAAERLRGGARSILEVALACGFQDPSRFARAFTRHHGCAPRAYRARFT